MRQKTRSPHQTLTDAKQKLGELDRQIDTLRRANERRDQAKRAMDVVAGDVLAGIATTAAEAKARAELTAAENAVVTAQTQLPLIETDRARLLGAMNRIERAAYDSQRAEDYRLVLPIVTRWIQKYEALRKEADADRALIKSFQGHYPDRAFINSPRLYPMDGDIPDPLMDEICTNPHWQGGGRISALLEALRAWVVKTEAWLLAHEESRLTVPDDRVVSDVRV
jgi:hypothetical protein